MVVLQWEELLFDAFPDIDSVQSYELNLISPIEQARNWSLPEQKSSGFVIDELKPATEYEFEITAIFNENTRTDPRRIFATTPVPAPDIFIGNVTHGSMSVQVSPVANVERWFVNIVPHVSDVPESFETTPNMNVDELIPGQDYQFKITAVLEPSLSTVSDGNELSMNKIKTVLNNMQVMQTQVKGYPGRSYSKDPKNRKKQFRKSSVAILHRNRMITEDFLQYFTKFTIYCKF